MIIRDLDGVHDWRFGKGKQNYLNAQNAIAENIQTRLLSFINDCFFDMTEGLDWFRLLGSHGTKQEIVLSVRAKILSSFGVLRVNSIGVVFTPGTRNITVTYNIDTIYTSNFLQNLEVGNG